MAARPAYPKLFSVILALLSQTVFAQVYSGKSPEYQANCLMRINKDSTINFIYYYDDNTLYAEYYGQIKSLNDTLFHISGNMTVGQFLMKAYRKDTIYIKIDSSITNQLGKIRVAFSNGSFKEYNFKEYNNYEKDEIGNRYLKMSVNKTLFNQSKGKDFFNLSIERKNPVTQKPLLFIIPFGSAASIAANEKTEFDVVIKNGYLWSVGKPRLQTGHFKLKRENK